MLAALVVLVQMMGGPVPVVERIEMRELAVQGQLTKAGEVQLLERKQAEVQSLVRLRTSFREEIVQSVFPESARRK